LLFLRLKSLHNTLLYLNFVFIHRTITDRRSRICSNPHE